MFELIIKYFGGEKEVEGKFDNYKDALETGKFMFAQVRGVVGYEIVEVV